LFLSEVYLTLSLSLKGEGKRERLLVILRFISLEDLILYSTGICEKTLG